MIFMFWRPWFRVHDSLSVELFFQHLAFDAVIQIITVFRAVDNVKEYWRKRAQVNDGL